ncbi:exonuclease domain-containing protein [Sphingomonas alba]|uniref:Exonuclease domain-containing protein n=1 Tax=Sphingomonas alba TaxID=2908208 RepID=A0ABT0RLC4_9SPHN|nr:exonuclease domain-containing protein [Sphingomonas alba]MCL6683454.1 exonuclease domain-containing protein [Sphingomonas alba]
MSFVFYDTETTGKNKFFDQILQFGAILTDDDLNEIDRFEIRCRLDEHTVPSAGALRVTGMTIERITDPALPSHYEMICQVRDRIAAWCPTTFVGWNTIGYDEPLLQQAFYRCLHPPYLTNTNGNQRADILKLAQCVEAFASDVLTLPRDEKGKPVYGLAQLAPANGFPHLNAHDAMADVEATIFICRKIKEKAPAAWEQLLHCASKSRALAVIHDNPVYVARSYSYQGGLKEHVLTTLGNQLNGMGAVLAYDLTVDPSQLVGLDDEQLGVWLRRKTSPLRTIKPNKAPLVAGWAGQPFDGIAYATLAERAAFLASRPDLVARIIALTPGKTYDPSDHVEEQIYNGFASPSDNAAMLRFHAAPWCDRFAIAVQIQDARFRALAMRLIYSHCPESLPSEMRTERARLVAMRLLGHGCEKAPFLTLAAADEEAAKMQAEGEAAHADMLRSYREYVAQKLQQASALLAGS